jgi:hypothetical protein
MSQDLRAIGWQQDIDAELRQQAEAEHPGWLAAIKARVTANN